MTDLDTPTPAPPPLSNQETEKLEANKKTIERCKFFNKELLKHFAVTQQTLDDTELVESSVLRYCIEQGATKITETDIEGIVGQANIAIASARLPDWMFGDTLFINYKSLTLEQRREVRDVLNKSLGFETFTLEDFNYHIAVRYDGFITGNFGEFQSLVFIDVTDFCEKLLPLLH